MEVKTFDLDDFLRDMLTNRLTLLSTMLDFKL